MHTRSVLALLLLLPAAALKYRGESKLKVVDQTQPRQISSVLAPYRHNGTGSLACLSEFTTTKETKLCRADGVADLQMFCKFCGSYFCSKVQNLFIVFLLILNIKFKQNV